VTHIARHSQHRLACRNSLLIDSIDIGCSSSLNRLSLSFARISVKEETDNGGQSNVEEKSKAKCIRCDFDLDRKNEIENKERGKQDSIIIY